MRFWRPPCELLAIAQMATSRNTSPQPRSVAGIGALLPFDPLPARVLRICRRYPWTQRNLLVAFFRPAFEFRSPHRRGLIPPCRLQTRGVLSCPCPVFPRSL